MESYNITEYKEKLFNVSLSIDNHVKNYYSIRYAYKSINACYINIHSIFVLLKDSQYGPNLKPPSINEC